MPRRPSIRDRARDVDRLRAVTCRFVSPCRCGATLAALALLASAAAAQEPAPAALPPEIARALARAGVPPENVALLVAPLAPPPGTVSRLPEPVNGVVMNPPFHEGRSADPRLGAGFIRSAAGLLTGAGRLWMVANRHLPYEQVLRECFADVSEIGGDSRFKILTATGAQRPGARRMQQKGKRR